jgi:hypothetical protein
MLGVTPRCPAGMVDQPPRRGAYFEKANWLEVFPEYNPFKYNSFAANAGFQTASLTRTIRNDLERVAANGGLEAIPADPHVSIDRRRDGEYTGVGEHALRIKAQTRFLLRRPSDSPVSSRGPPTIARGGCAGDSATSPPTKSQAAGTPSHLGSSGYKTKSRRLSLSGCRDGRPSPAAVRTRLAPPCRPCESRSTASGCSQ